MATGKDKLFISPAQVVGAQDLETLRTYNTEEFDSFVSAIMFANDSTSPAAHSAQFGGLNITHGAGTGNTKLVNLASSDPWLRKLAVIIFRGEKDSGAVGKPGKGQFEMLTFESSDDGFLNEPFKNNGVGPYQIALRANDYPATVTADLNGVFIFDRWRNGIGERLTPTAALTDLAPGLRLKITSTDLFPAWSDTSWTRPCRVWLNDPVTGTTEAFYDGVAKSDGVDVYVDTTHYFGQGTPSLTAADYTVHVHGFTISDKAVTDLTTESDVATGIRVYHQVAEYDPVAGFMDESVQVVFPTLTSLSELVSNDPLAALGSVIRAGAYLGDYSETRDWNDTTNVTTNDAVAPATLAFDSFGFINADGAFMASGGPLAADPIRIMQAFVVTGPSAPGYTATHAHSAATGTYVVYARAQPEPSSPNTFAVVLTTVLESSLTAAQKRQMLLVYRFDWTTETAGGANDGVFGTETAIDLNLRRGIWDGRGMSSQAETGSNTDAVLVAEQIFAGGTAGTKLDIMARDAADPTYTSKRIASFYRAAAALNRLQLFSSLGEAGGTPVDMPNSDRVEIQFGGFSDFEMAAQRDGGGNRTFTIKGAVTNDWELDRAGGNSNGNTGRNIVEDLHLRVDKDCERSVPMLAARGDIGRVVLGGLSTQSSEMDTIIRLPRATDDGTVTTPQAFLSTKIATANSLRINDIVKIRIEAEMLAADGNQLDYLDARMNTTGAETGGAALFTEVNVTPAVGEKLSFEMLGIVQAIGGSGRIDWVERGTATEWDVTNPAPLSVGRRQIAAVDTTADLYLAIHSKWSAGSAGANDQQVEVSIIHVERTRSDVWYYDPDVLKERWTCEVGNNRRLDIPIPIDQGYNHKLVTARVYCGLDATDASDQLDLTLYEFDIAANTLASLATATQLTTGGWKDLTPGTPTVIDDAKRYFIRIETAHGGAATVPGFFVQGVEKTTRMSELH